METWVLQQVSSISQLNSLKPSLQTALETDAIGLSLRVPGKSIETNLDLLDAAREVIDKQLAIRFMAGRDTPETSLGRYFIYNGSATGGQGAGAKVPVTFLPDGKDNLIFFDWWSNKALELVVWASNNDVKLLHLPWPGLLWAELALVTQHMSLRGYSMDRVAKFHEDMMDYAVLMGVDVEFPISGHCPQELRNRITQYAKTKNYPNLIISANNFTGSPQGIPKADSLRRALQMVGTGDFDWPMVYLTAETVEAEYLEVYRESFFSAGAVSLRAQITAHSNGSQIAQLERELLVVQGQIGAANTLIAEQTVAIADMEAMRTVTQKEKSDLIAEAQAIQDQITALEGR